MNPGDLERKQRTQILCAPTPLHSRRLGNSVSKQTGTGLGGNFCLNMRVCVWLCVWLCVCVCTAFANKNARKIMNAYTTAHYFYCTYSNLTQGSNLNTEVGRELIIEGRREGSSHSPIPRRWDCGAETVIVRESSLCLLCCSVLFSVTVTAARKGALLVLICDN